jgi:hypothetical protein
MKPSSGDKQLGMLSPLKSAAMQSGQTNHPSQNEVGLDVSHHIHLSLEGRGKYFFLDILFHRMSAIGISRQLSSLRALPQPQVGQLYRPYGCPRQENRVMGSAQLWIASRNADIQNTCEFPGESIHSLLM